MSDSRLSAAGRSSQMMRAEEAVSGLIRDLEAARKAGQDDARLKGVLALQRKAQWRVDFVNAENSMGFHAPQETARILAEAIDYARQGQATGRTLVRRELPTVPQGGVPGRESRPQPFERPGQPRDLRPIVREGRGPSSPGASRI